MEKLCPCDLDGQCPYDAQYFSDCEYHCGVGMPEPDYPEYYLEDGEDWDI